RAHRRHRGEAFPQAHHAAALLVDGGEEGAARFFLEGAAEVGDLGRRLDVAGEEDGAADAAADQLLHLRRDGGPVKSHAEEPRDGFVEGRHVRRITVRLGEGEGGAWKRALTPAPAPDRGLSQKGLASATRVSTYRRSPVSRSE